MNTTGQFNIILPNELPSLNVAIPILLVVNNNEKDENVYIVDMLCPRASIEVYCATSSRNTQFKAFIRFINTTSDIYACVNGNKSIHEKFNEFRVKYSAPSILNCFSELFKKKNLDTGNMIIENNIKEMVSSFEYGCGQRSSDIIMYFCMLGDLKSLCELSHTTQIFNYIISNIFTLILTCSDMNILLNTFNKVSIRKMIRDTLNDYAKKNLYCFDYVDMFTAVETLYKYMTFHANKHTIEYLLSFFNYLNPNYISYVPKSEKYLMVSVCKELEEKAMRVISILENSNNIEVDFNMLYNTYNIVRNITKNNKPIKADKSGKKCGCSMKQSCDECENFCYCKATQSCDKCKQNKIKPCGCNFKQRCDECNVKPCGCRQKQRCDECDKPKSKSKDCGCSNKQRCDICETSKILPKKTDEKSNIKDNIIVETPDIPVSIENKPQQKPFKERAINALQKVNIFKKSLSMSSCGDDKCEICENISKDIVRTMILDMKAKKEVNPSFSTEILDIPSICKCDLDDHHKHNIESPIKISLYEIDDDMGVNIGNNVRMNIEEILKTNTCPCKDYERCDICSPKSQKSPNSNKMLNMSHKVKCDGINFKGKPCGNLIVITDITPSSKSKGDNKRFCSSACMARFKSSEDNDLYD